MADNAEEGIARTQAAAARRQGGDANAIHAQQKQGGEYIGQRIVTFFAAIAFLLMIGVWATTESPLLLYGSLALAVAVMIGYA